MWATAERPLLAFIFSNGCLPMMQGARFESSPLFVVRPAWALTWGRKSSAEPGHDTVFRTSLIMLAVAHVSPTAREGPARGAIGKPAAETAGAWRDSRYCFRTRLPASLRFTS